MSRHSEAMSIVPTAEAPQAAPDQRDPCVAAAELLDAAQALRRAIAAASTRGDSLAVLAALEATLDSVGASLAELRGPLLEQVDPHNATHPGSRAEQLDTARLVAQMGGALSDAATHCGELRNIVARR